MTQRRGSDFQAGRGAPLPSARRAPTPMGSCACAGRARPAEGRNWMHPERAAVIHPPAKPATPCSLSLSPSRSTLAPARAARTSQVMKSDLASGVDAPRIGVMALTHQTRVRAICPRKHARESGRTGARPWGLVVQALHSETGRQAELLHSRRCSDHAGRPEGPPIRPTKGSDADAQGTRPAGPVWERCGRSLSRPRQCSSTSRP